MGRKLDALLGKTFKSYRFKALISLAITRASVLKSQRQIRSSQALSDVVKLLNLGHHERALIRIEQVIKEQNMLDVFVMIEKYCNLLIERISLIEIEKECPDELTDAISGLIFAASRCGEFPELQEMRAVFISKFGKDFVARATELRNNCGVNPVLIQKMSTRTPSIETRIKVLKEIALENGIDLKLDDPISGADEQRNLKPNQNLPVNGTGNSDTLTDGMDDSLTGSGEIRKKYKDVSQAAEEAFKSAAQAAAAARAAVELSRPGSGGGGLNGGYSNNKPQSKDVKDDAKPDDFVKMGNLTDKHPSEMGKNQPMKRDSSDSEDQNAHSKIREEDFEFSEKDNSARNSAEMISAVAFEQSKGYNSVMIDESNKTNISVTENRDQDSDQASTFSLSTNFLQDEMAPNCNKLQNPLVSPDKRTWKRPISVRTRR